MVHKQILQYKEDQCEVTYVVQHLTGYRLSDHYRRTPIATMCWGKAGHHSLFGLSLCSHLDTPSRKEGIKYAKQRLVKAFYEAKMADDKKTDGAGCGAYHIFQNDNVPIDISILIKEDEMKIFSMKEEMTAEYNIRFLSDQHLVNIDKSIMMKDEDIIHDKNTVSGVTLFNLCNIVFFPFAIDVTLPDFVKQLLLPENLKNIEKIPILGKKDER